MVKHAEVTLKNKDVITVQSIKLKGRLIQFLEKELNVFTETIISLLLS